MPFDPRRVKALFNSALDLADPADRPAFLDRECGDDLELRRRLDELLAAHDRPAVALERPLAAGVAGAPTTAGALDPATAGSVTEAIAEGPTASYRLQAPPPCPL